MRSPSDRDRGKVEKRPYQKPRLRIVEVSMGEVLGSGCWTDSTYAVAQETCGFSTCAE
jgi:hypothetical protein